jgi:hypothetical protein
MLEMLSIAVLIAASVGAVAYALRFNQGEDDGVHRGTAASVHGDPNNTGIAGSGGTGGGGITPAAPTFTQLAYTRYLAQSVTAQRRTSLMGAGHLLPAQHPYGQWPSVAKAAQPIERTGIVLGEVIAYRAWIEKDGFLCSVAADRIWAPGEAMEAAKDFTPHGEDGGVHAFKERAGEFEAYVDGATAYYAQYSRGVPDILMRRPIIGEVRLWGEVIEHELGYRAQYAYPKRLIANGVDPAILAKITKRYGLEEPLG